MIQASEELESERLILAIEQRGALHLDEAAAYLGLGRSSMYELVRQGHVPSFKVGRRLLIPRQMLDDWMEEHARERKDVVI